MSPERLAGLLARLAPDLEVMEEPWMIIGSAALIILGLPLAECQDLDILTTEAGAVRLEDAWRARRAADHRPNPDDPFRSRFSRYVMAGGAVEVMGDLRVMTTEGWRGVWADAVERRPFGSGLWPVPTPTEQERILRLFGRPKDLRRAASLQSWRRTAG